MKAKAKASTKKTPEQEEALRIKRSEQRRFRKYRAAAHDKYGGSCSCSDGDIDFDDKPRVSEGTTPGAYVQAWVWVTNEEAHVRGG